MMNGTFRFILCSVIVFGLLPSSSIAEDKKTEFDEVTVYATKSPQSTFDVPALVSKIDAQSEGNALSSTVSALLEFTPGVDVSNSPRRNGQVINIRGFDDEAIITLIDGRRQNFESAHDGRFYLDPSILRSVEVVKGSASAIYGQGAVGGVVAFETRDAEDFLLGEEGYGAFTSIGYRSAMQDLSPSLTGFFKEGGWDVLGNFTYRQSDDIDLGNSQTLEAEDQMFSGLLKASYTFLEHHKLSFQSQALRNDSREPNNGAGEITPSNPIVDKEVQDFQTGLRYTYESNDTPLIRPSLHLYYNDTEVEEEDIGGRAAGRVQTRELDTLGFTAENRSTVEVSEVHKHVITFGGEVYRDDQVGTRTGADSRPGVPDADATNYGFFLQDEMSFISGIGDIIIIPAVRFDAYDSGDENGNSQDENRTTPRVALTYKPLEELMFFSSWGQAFRAPNLTELYSAGLHFPGVPMRFPNNNFVPNPDLAPEVVETIEVGAGVDFDHLIAEGDKLNIKGSWFRSDGKDFITQEINIVEGTTRNINIANADIQGWEVEASYQIAGALARIGVYEVRAENDDTGENLSNNVPLTVVSDFNYRIAALSSVIGWRSRFAERNDRVGEDDEPTAGYGVHDIYLRYTPDAEDFDTFTFDVGVENLFDKAYTRRFASLPEPGTSFVTRVAYQW